MNYEFKVIDRPYTMQVFDELYNEYHKQTLPDTTCLIVANSRENAEEKLTKYYPDCKYKFIRAY